MSTIVSEQYGKDTCLICNGAITREPGSNDNGVFHHTCKLVASTVRIDGQLPFPCERAYIRAASILDDCEGDCDLDRWNAFKKAMMNLPLVNAVQPNLWKKDCWSDEERLEWENLAEQIGDADFVKRMATKKAFGKKTITQLPIPDGHLTFDVHASELIQNGHIQNRPVPLFDLGYIISSGETMGAFGSGFNDWKAFIQCLWAIGSGPCSEDSFYSVISINRCETLVDGLTQIPGTWTVHPFSAIHQFLSTSGPFLNEDFQPTYDDNPWNGRRRLISFLGGPVVHAWEKLLTGDKEETTTIRNHRGCLSSLKGELFLPIIRGENIEFIEVPLDLDLWRILITLEMYPHNTELGDLLIALGHCWERRQQNPDNPNARSLRLLNSIMDAEADSIQIVDSHFVVKGQSGLGHRLKIASQEKMHIQSYRSMDVAMKPDKGEMFFEPCIDMNDSQPIGDMIVTYLLTLRNDIDAKDGVTTLEPAVELRLEFESVPTASAWAEAMDGQWGQDFFFDDSEDTENEYLEFDPSEFEGWDEEEENISGSEGEPLHAGWTQAMIDEFLDNMYKNEI